MKTQITISRYVILVSLALFAAGPALTQNSSETFPEEHAQAVTPAPPIAYVYVGTAQGVFLYDTAASGQLSLVYGSPFQTTGLMAGSNGKYFVSVGTNYIHTSPVASNGAIEKQASEIDTQNYLGAACGTNAAAGFDKTGQSLYVLLANGGSCGALQSFQFAKNSGALTFVGSAEYNTGANQEYWLTSAPTMTGNNKFAYASNQIWSASNPPAIAAFVPDSTGMLQFLSITETDPEPPSATPIWVGVGLSADSVNHLAVAAFSNDDEGDVTPTQLASYTVDGSGNISSTNTYQNMPTPDVNVNSIQLSPSGQFLSVASNNIVCSGCPAEPGLQVFQFNGAKPITPLSGILTNAPIDFIAWDQANHLYAVSDSTMYVYTVSGTTIAAAPGSPFLINAGPNGRDNVNALVVVPK